jgi:hypothetical protein
MHSRIKTTEAPLTPMKIIHRNFQVRRNKIGPRQIKKYQL